MGTTRPNIVYIIVHDTGWTSLGCCGSDYHQTPHLDALAAQGVRFQRMYAAGPICIPSRCSVHTGILPARNHMTGGRSRIKRPDRKMKTPVDHGGEEVFAVRSGHKHYSHFLHDAGYATGFFGNEHPDPADTQDKEVGEQYRNTNFGYDVAVHAIHYKIGNSMFPPYGNTDLINPVPGEGMSERLTREAVGFLEANKEGPFFLHLAYSANHGPDKGSPDKVAKYEALPKGKYHRYPEYAAMLESVDDGVGTIIAKLEDLGIRQNTLVIFTADHGGPEYKKPDMHFPLRSGKWTLYEGGIRIPFIASWPGEIEAGTICDDAVYNTSLFATFIEIGGNPDAAQGTDSISILPLLRGGKSEADRGPLYFHIPHYAGGAGFPVGAMIDGQWKLLEFFEDGHLELYNLANDIGERNNLAEDQPERAGAMHEKLKKWRKEVDAEMPWWE